MTNSIKINEKFKDVLNKLKLIEYRGLENSILEFGCKIPIIVWNNQIVDGHHRYEICQKHNLDFLVREVSFADDDDAIRFIIRNQIGRRNLTKQEMMLMIGLFYRTSKLQKGAPAGNLNATKSLNPSSEMLDNDSQWGQMPTSDLPTAKRTSEKIAEKYNIDEKTVRRAEKLAEAFEKSDDETKLAFHGKKISQNALLKLFEQEETKFISANNGKPYPLGKDVNTEFMYQQGVRAENELRIFFEAIKKFKQKTPPASEIPKPLDNFYNLLEQSLKKINNMIEGLNNQYICNYCEATGCVNCQGGYILEVNYKLQLKACEENPTIRGSLKKVKEINNWEW